MRFRLTGRLRLPATISLCATFVLFVSVNVIFPAGTRLRDSTQARALIFTVTFVGAAGAARPSSRGITSARNAAATPNEAARGKRRAHAIHCRPKSPGTRGSNGDVDLRELVEDRVLRRGHEAGAVQDGARAVHRSVVGGVGDGDDRQAASEADRQGTVVPRELDRQQPGCGAVDGDRADVDERKAALGGDEAKDLGRVDEAQLDEHLAEPLSVRARVLQRDVDLGISEQPGLRQQRAERGIRDDLRLEQQLAE